MNLTIITNTTVANTVFDFLALNLF